MLPVIILDDAEGELAEAEAFYESQRIGLGPEFLSAIGETVERIAAHPGSAPLHPIVGDPTGARTAPVKRFPYSVIYVEHEGAIWVIAFAHQRRRPGYWAGRAGPS